MFGLFQNFGGFSGIGSPEIAVVGPRCKPPLVTQKTNLYPPCAEIQHSVFHVQPSLLAILYEQVHGTVHRLSHLTFIDNKEIPNVGTETLTCTTKKVFKTRCLASNFLLPPGEPLRV